MDLLGDLGHLALASRLKRLGERLLQEVSQVYAAHHVGFRARWFPVLNALGRQSPQAVSELAAVLGLTHTGVAQIAAEMQRAGLVRSTGDPGDGRRRLLHLTAQGEATTARLVPFWKEIREATAELVAESGHDLLAALAAVEGRLAARPMAERLAPRLTALATAGEVEVVGWDPAFAARFRELNLAWLADFGVEAEDQAVLDDPAAEVVARGGEVLFATVDGAAVGTCALIDRGGCFELAKMAVEPPFRGRGIGRRLAAAAVAHARAAGHSTLFLLTSPRLEAALALYQAIGFQRVESPPVPRPAVARCSIVMTLDLAAAAPAIPGDRT